MAASENPETSQTEPDPRARLMHEVAEQMDAIESDFPNGFQIGRVITVVEVGPLAGPPSIRVRANMLPWVAMGMLKIAERFMEASMTSMGDNPPDAE